MTPSKNPNDPGPTEGELKLMAKLPAGEVIKRGDWIGDINEWSDSDLNGVVGEEFENVWRFL